MDLKGLSWVGDMYQKFESLRAEVEETMYPDTVKFVENQAQTIGATFKKIYVEVMHDLQPPSSSDTVQAEAAPSCSDSLKAESSPSLNPLKAETRHVTVAHNADLSVYNMRQVSSEEYVNHEVEHLVKSSDAAAHNNDTENSRSCCSAICSVSKPCSVEEQWVSGDVGCQCSVEDEDQCRNGNIECQCADSEFSSPVSFGVEDLEQKPVSEQKPRPGALRLNAYVTKESGEKFTFRDENDGNDESLCGLGHVGSESTSVVGVSHSEEDGRESNEMTKDNESFNPGAVEGSNSKTTASSCWSIPEHLGEISYPVAACKIQIVNADNHGASVIEQVDEVNLGEYCVLLEENECCHRLPLREEQKSYKKKIKDMLSTRRKPKVKRDTDQVAVWYDEQCGKNLLPSSLVHGGVQDSQLDNSSESDWELV